MVKNNDNSQLRHKSKSDTIYFKQVLKVIENILPFFKCVFRMNEGLLYLCIGNQTFGCCDHLQKMAVLFVNIYHYLNLNNW